MYFYIHAFDYMYAFDCMHASCTTGAVYVFEGSNASFGGETVFAGNTAETGGATVTCTRHNESQMTRNEISSRKGIFW